MCNKKKNSWDITVKERPTHWILTTLLIRRHLIFSYFINLFPKFESQKRSSHINSYTYPYINKIQPNVLATSTSPWQVRLDLSIKLKVTISVAGYYKNNLWHLSHACNILNYSLSYSYKTFQLWYINAGDVFYLS